MPFTIADRILATRRQIPDMPASLPAPGVSFGSTGTGSMLPAGTYYAVFTQFNQYGESLPSAEAGPLFLPANSFLIFNVIPSPTATVVRMYITVPNGGSGNEILYLDTPTASPYTGTVQVVMAALPATAQGVPPTRGSAYLPISDGRQFSATALYSWLNAALNKVSHAVNGILDYCGVPTVSGQPLYVVPGQWLTISDVWYGGYWIQGGQRQWFYRRNAVTSQVLSAVTISIQSNKQVIEVSYQPDRSSGVTATTNVMTVTDTSVGIASSSVFLLPFGFAMLSGPDMLPEIVAYSNLTGNTMSGLIRGIGGTVAQPWNDGATVTELSLFWCGKRIFSDDTYSPVPVYNPGTGLTLPAAPPETIIPVPDGWAPIIDKYMLAQAKFAEQDTQAAQAMEAQALKDAIAWMNANRGVEQFVQVGGAAQTLTFDWSVAGGIIIPS
jgi:hypothetical protein